MPAPVCYAVRFRMQVHSSFSAASSSDVWLERTVQLPIPPCVGLEVSEGYWSAKITNLYLPLERGIVEAWGEDKEIYDALRNRETPRPIEEIVKEYEDCGWVRSPRHNTQAQATPTETDHDS